jgi:hypothetical protein
MAETPKQTQLRRARQRQKDQAQEQSVSSKDPGQLNVPLPKDQQPSGQDKQNQITLKKAINFVAANLGVVDQVLKSLGLPNSQDLRDLQTQGEQAVEAFIQEQACANQETLQEAVRIRNEINEQLGKLGQSYNLTNQALNRLSDFLTGQIDSITLIKQIRSAANAASALIPSPPGVPGAVTSLLTSSKDVIDLLLFTALGQPKLAKVKATIDSGLMFISMSSQALRRILEPLNILDRLLVKCGQTVTPRPESIIQLQQVNQTTETSNNFNYKGFTLEVIEEPFSQTVTRRKAVAKNDQGIILVETPLSFTTLDQVLLDQVKFIIDSQNLKPN